MPLQQSTVPSQRNLAYALLVKTRPSLLALMSKREFRDAGPDALHWFDKKQIEEKSPAPGLTIRSRERFGGNTA